MMQTIPSYVIALTAVWALAGSHGLADPLPNTLTATEKAAGWRLLFDGQTTSGWRNFKKPDIANPAAWTVEDGWLRKVGGVRGGDIITTDQFTDFELQWEWRIPPRANNGIKYFITEERGSAIGHEYQMIDNGKGGVNKGSTASFYAVLAPKEHAPVRLAPQFNHSRIVVQGHLVEHWLNGEKVLEYTCGSDEVLTNVAKSKFKDVKGFGTKIKGHLLLTDHGSECAFRNIKIRELAPR